MRESEMWPSIVSCTYIPTDLCDAWSYNKEVPVSEEEFASEGLTQIAGGESSRYLNHLPQSAWKEYPSRATKNLIFGCLFNQSLDRVTLSGNLHGLTFGQDYNQSLDRVTLPSNHLTFGSRFNQSLAGMTLPGNLQSLTFGKYFDQSLHRLTLPDNLLSLTVGWLFNQSLEGMTLPGNLQPLTFGEWFNQSREQSRC